MSDPINPDELPPGIEQTYEKVRAALPNAAQADGALVELAPLVRVIALRTATLPPAAHTNCYVIGPTNHPGSLLLVDPGSPYPESRATLDELLLVEQSAGRRPAAVLLTHAHADHTSGAMHLKHRWNVEILAHEACAAQLAGRVAIDRVVAEGEARVADLELTFLHTPGHAPGHLCAVLPHSGAVIAGDMVAGVGTILIDPSEGDMSAYLDSLERLAALGDRMLLPAHGPAIAQGLAKLRAYRAHRLEREAKIYQALRELGPASAEQLVPVAYADTPAPFWPLAVRSTIAHLMKLAREGRARQHGASWGAAE